MDNEANFSLTKMVNDSQVNLVVLPSKDYEEIKADLKVVRKILEQQPKSSEEVIYSRFELAKKLDRTPETITRWTKQGILKGHTIGRKRYYKESEILAALKGHNLED